MTNTKKGQDMVYDKIALLSQKGNEALITLMIIMIHCDNKVKLIEQERLDSALMSMNWKNQLSIDLFYQNMINKVRTARSNFSTDSLIKKSVNDISEELDKQTFLDLLQNICLFDKEISHQEINIINICTNQYLLQTAE